MIPMTGCIVCGAVVEFPEHTLLCNKCDKENLDYANRDYSEAERVELLVIPPAFSWGSQACQYAQHGPPGLGHERHALDARGNEVALDDRAATMLVDCLLMRDVHGELVGILNHYTGESELEKTGNINVWVRPDRQRRGIATRLLREAQARWDVDWRTQRYTTDGLALLKKVMSS